MMTTFNTKLAAIADVLARLEKRLDQYFPPLDEQKEGVYIFPLQRVSEMFRDSFVRVTAVEALFDNSLAAITSVLTRLEKRLDYYFPPFDEQTNNIADTLGSVAVIETLKEMLGDGEKPKSNTEFNEEAANILLHANEDEYQFIPQEVPLTPEQQDVLDTLLIYAPITIRDLKCKLKSVHLKGITIDLAEVLNELVLIGRVKRCYESGDGNHATTLYLLTEQTIQEKIPPQYGLMEILDKQLKLLESIAEKVQYIDVPHRTSEPQS
ncbi:MAG: hypothetical protein LBI05_08420 [Planctomycetaceae bacterium]|jgi:hypothetical protein|nr:hypothetical protein [Planctomycetaceae bacterium]